MNFLHLPTLETERLLLRPFAIADAGRVQRLAGDRRIAEMTHQIPYPYPDGLAAIWIASHPMLWKRRRFAPFAVTRRDTRELVGAVSLRFFAQGPWADLGFWIGAPFWNQGYATEAAREVLRFGFETLDLQGIQASHFTNNPASQRVLEKLGMRYQGVIPNGISRNGRLLDIADYSLAAGNFSDRLQVA